MQDAYERGKRRPCIARIERIFDDYLPFNMTGYIRPLNRKHDGFTENRLTFAGLFNAAGTMIGAPDTDPTQLVMRARKNRITLYHVH